MLKNKANAMVFEEIDQPFKSLILELPELEDQEIEVKISYTTICTSDLHTYFGRRSSPCPSVLGHEIIGHISKIKTENTLDFFGEVLAVGDFITWSIYAFDKTDVMSQKGIPQKSLSLYKYGHQKMSETDVLNGGFATHCILKKGTSIFKLPKHLTPKQAAPLNCTHATIAGALRLAGNLTGKNVLVLGAGMLGLSACAMAAEASAAKVMATDTNSNRLEWAKKFGATICFDATKTTDSLIDLLKPHGLVDVVIDTT
ncbi:MAG: alcohol dehydrogenase catalytic domain-containing protein, partial [Polaribacter sp.]